MEMRSLSRWFGAGPLKLHGIGPNAIVRPRTAILLTVLCLCRPGVAQQVSFALLPPRAGDPAPITAPIAAPIAAPIIRIAPVKTENPPQLPEGHRFWDRQNSVLFATSAAFSAGDFVVTRDNLRSGGQELNPMVGVFGHSSAGLAMNFVGETAGVVAISYFFHKTGHHKLERAVSMLNIGSSAAAVTYGMANR
jgi:hypothetical protein